MEKHIYYCLSLKKLRYQFISSKTHLITSKIMASTLIFLLSSSSLLLMPRGEFAQKLLQLVAGRRAAASSSVLGNKIAGARLIHQVPSLIEELALQALFKISKMHIFFTCVTVLFSLSLYIQELSLKTSHFQLPSWCGTGKEGSRKDSQEDQGGSSASQPGPGEAHTPGTQWRITHLTKKKKEIQSRSEKQKHAAGEKLEERDVQGSPDRLNSDRSNFRN